MKKRIGTWAIYLVLAIFAIIFLVPFYVTLINSFKGIAEIFFNIFGLPKEWTFANYTTVVDMIKFPAAFLNSAIITIGGLAGIVLFSSMAAYRLVRVKTKFHRALYFLFVASMVVPFPAVMLPLVKVVSTANLYNSHLGVIFCYYGFGVAMPVVLYYGFLKSVPASMEEAAVVDGCSQPRVFFSVVMPLLKPTTATLIVLDIIWLWNDYLLPAILLTRMEKRTVPLAISFLFDQYNSRWDMAMAAVVLSILPVIVVFLTFQKYIVAGITSGAVKG